MSKKRDRDKEVEELNVGIKIWLTKHVWKRLPEKYRYNVEPEDINLTLLPGEVPQLEIHLAWYRDLLPLFVFGNFGLLLILTVMIAAILYISFNILLLMLIPVVFLIFASIEAFREFIDYNQWRLIKTNTRIIISLPQQNAWPLVDHIELGTKPQVIDTNWSTNPVWRIFQFFTGARDVYISLAAFKFEEGAAVVKDALIMPDVMPDDVFELKKYVFGLQ